MLRHRVTEPSINFKINGTIQEKSRIKILKFFLKYLNIIVVFKTTTILIAYVKIFPCQSVLFYNDF